MKNIHISLILLTLVWIQTGIGMERRLDPQLADSLAQLTDDPCVQADYYTRAWMNDRAISVLEESGVRSSAVLWRLARARIDKGENLEGDEALALYEQAMSEAQSAVDQDPSNPMAQQTLAVACGRVALFKGVFKTIGLVKRVHNAALMAVALGDSMPIALYILGRTHKTLIEKPRIIRVPLGLGWASEDSVSYYFNRALEVSGGNMIQCRVEYADFWLSEEDDTESAVLMLRAALELPFRDEQDQKGKQRAREMLDETGNR